MKRNRLLLLLALLMTAATGAWAQDTYKIDAVYTINGQSGSQDFSIDDASLPFTKKLSELDPNGSDWIANNLDAAYITVSGDNIVKGTDANWDTEITINGAGTATVSYVIQLTGYVEVGTATITFTVTKNEAPAAPKHLVTATFDKQTRLLEQALPYATTIGELYEAVTGQSFSDLISRMSALESPLNEITSLNPSVVIIGELNGASTPVTVIADGQATVSFKFGNYAQGIYVSVTPPLYVTMKDGTQDADKWTVKVGEGEAQALPIGGLKGDGTETVTLKYNGRLKVKSVTATSDAAPAGNPNAYLKWDATKKDLVEAEIPATVTNVANADADVTWEAGTYVVDGEVNINGTIKLNGNVDLIIKDGAKLTANQIVGYDKNLSIFGQSNQTGQLVVNCSGNAIQNINTLEVHSCQVKATSSANSYSGFNNIQTFSVYGGSVDAEYTATSGGYGISMYSSGSMNIYGGDVKAVGKGNKFGIRGSSTTVTVYGGKLWAECAGNKAIDTANTTLTKGTGFTGKIETSADGTSWTEYTSDGTPDTNYVRVGY